ncbi:hypothetical protein A1O3_01037 [Capronia epimyces CBS 606.96]|uniref:Uncharacterized protein n=1 Tax=Capronia epimyces CBS 606.96 TaxID=1182542 RepID=W9YS52_9EURO|nr:uncharacterized protein A1O3_01037 [Capronia epimyces CBS 606.96]EXJ92485.1 hypothetical protein A1O3_01037 [Capronia epimyces CBS 606.96]
MTIRKQSPRRKYGTFPQDSASESDGSVGDGDSHTSYHQTDSDKSRSAAVEAQRLASQGSWADTFAGGTPATIQTPAASTVNGDEATNVQYPHLAQEPDLSDPPPLYTPSDTTAPSPVVARSVAASEPVSAPVAAPSFRYPLQYSRRDDESDDDDEEEEEEQGDDGALLPEPVQHQSQLQHHHNRTPVAEGDSIPTLLRWPDKSSSKRWCGGHRKQRGCGGRRRGRGGGNKERARRFKRACFFVFALLLCLWLMIPGLLKALPNDGSSQFPVSDPKSSSSPWPPEKRVQRQHETSRSIRGTYQLYDLLDLSTTSGSISVDVEVQPGDQPAVLRIATSSGSVHVRMTSERGWFHKHIIPEAVKERTLQTDISTQSGSVSGALVHGNGGSTRISTHSGSISVDIFTVGVSEQDPASNISTTTDSASQNIRLVAPLDSSEPVRAIGASHTVLGSGSMSIRYPMEWEGTVHALVQGSGSLSAVGHGLVVRQQNSRELYGYKGNKEGRQIEVFEQGSGSVRFQC